MRTGRNPSEQNDRLRTRAVVIVQIHDQGPAAVHFGLTAARSQTLTVLSSLPLTMRLPSGLNATHSISSVCPLRAKVSRPLSASQTLISPGLNNSPPALTMRLPS